MAYEDSYGYEPEDDIYDGTDREYGINWSKDVLGIPDFPGDAYRADNVIPASRGINGGLYTLQAREREKEHREFGLVKKLALMTGVAALVYYTITSLLISFFPSEEARYYQPLQSVQPSSQYFNRTPELNDKDKIDSKILQEQLMKNPK